VSTGVIIKPHLLERSKAKQVQLESREYTYLSGSYDIRDTGSLSLVKKQFTGDISLTGSISIGHATGSSGGTFGGVEQLQSNNFFWSHSQWTGIFDTSSNQYLTSYTGSVMTPDGPISYEYHKHEEARYDGELSGSYFKITTGELNDENSFKYDNPVISKFRYNFVNANLDCTIVFGEYVPPSPTPTNTPTPTLTPTTTPPPDCNFDLTVTFISN
jgi:hypothetical protein